MSKKLRKSEVIHYQRPKKDTNFEQHQVECLSSHAVQAKLGLFSENIFYKRVPLHKLFLFSVQTHLLLLLAILIEFRCYVKNNGTVTIVTRRKIKILHRFK